MQNATSFSPAWLLALFFAAGGAAAQSSNAAFTVQGHLRDASLPAQGSFDFRARLLLDPGSPETQGGVVATQVVEDVPLTDGFFTLVLDFTDVPFREFPGSYAIELGARPGSSVGEFQVFDRRLLLERVPTARVALNAAPASVGGDAIVDTEVQRRVSGSCPIGQAIRAVTAAGTVVCDVDDRGIEIATAQGLTGGGSTGSVTLSVDYATVQRRVSGQCPSGQAIRAIGADGSVVCEYDDAAGEIQIQQATANFSGAQGSTTQAQAGAACPSFWRAIAGGYSSTCLGVFVIDNTPNASSTGWFVRVIKPSTTACATPSTLTVYAVCVQG